MTNQGKQCERCGKGTYEIADLNDEIHGELHCNNCGHFSKLNSTPKTKEIKSVIVTRSIEYSPEAYLECCKEDDEEPTQEGFIEFIQDWIYDDFRCGNTAQEITELNY